MQYIKPKWRPQTLPYSQGSTVESERVAMGRRKGGTPKGQLSMLGVGIAV